MTLPPGYSLCAERPDDAAAIETLLDTAFGADRRAKRSYSYRRGVARVASLSLVARDPTGGLVGTIRYWPIRILREGSSEPALLLGPLAIEPRLKGLGVGRALVNASLAMAKAQGHRLVLLVGDTAYYGQFGFMPAAPLGFVMPHEQPQRLQALELVTGALQGGGELAAEHSVPVLTAARRRSGEVEGGVLA